MVPFSKIAGERMFIYAIYGCVNLWYSYGPKKTVMKWVYFMIYKPSYRTYNSLCNLVGP